MGEIPDGDVAIDFQAKQYDVTIPALDPLAIVFP